MILPPNPTELPAVTYEYLFFLPSSDLLNGGLRGYSRGLVH
jgi:hypothetical protein